MKTTLLSPNSNKTFFLLLFFVATGCLFSCKKDNTVSKKVIVGESKVKLINATQHTSIDFFLDDIRVNEQALVAGGSTDYLKVSSGTKKASVSVVGTLPSAITLVPTLAYTSFYVENRDGAGEVITFEDNSGAIPAGQTRIRFVNASPNFTNSISVNLAGNTLLVNALSFKENSGYFMVDPNTDVRVSVLGTAGVKIMAGIEFLEGKTYTIWFSGTSNANLTLNKIAYN